MASSLLSNTSSFLGPKRSFFSHGQFRSNLSFPLQRQQPPDLAIRAHWKRTQQFAVKASGEQGPLCTRQFKVQASSFDGADSREEKSEFPQGDTSQNKQGRKAEAISNNERYIVHFTTVVLVSISLFCFFIAFVLLFQPISPSYYLSTPEIPNETIVALFLAFLLLTTIANFVCLIVLKLKMIKIEELLKEGQGKSDNGEQI